MLTDTLIQIGNTSAGARARRMVDVVMRPCAFSAPSARGGAGTARAPRCARSPAGLPQAACARRGASLLYAAWPAPGARGARARCRPSDRFASRARARAAVKPPAKKKRVKTLQGKTRGKSGKQITEKAEIQAQLK